MHCAQTNYNHQHIHILTKHMLCSNLQSRNQIFLAEL
uniref:Uncharacterized protein n=1 Tax=Rhizophora mucronata TaxID=61149 RepID=A0A2P2P5Z6_RHIMU